MRVLVLHGPNLKLLGKVYDELNASLATQAKALGFELEVFQANGEAALLDELHRRREWLDAVVVNPTSLAPVAYGLAEALEFVGKRAIEVQLVEGRSSVLREVVEAQCHGEGAYGQALEVLSGSREAEKVEDESDDETDQTPARARAGKSMGRKPSSPAPAQVVQGSARKTIGRSTSAGGPAPAVKSIGRAEKPSGAEAVAAVTRSMVKAQVARRLSGGMAPEALAVWARGQWQGLMAGAPFESGQKDVLEDVLLTLSSAVKANDHVLLALVAKLDR